MKIHQGNLSDVHITILAGGSGTRLWPRSRKERPKQLLELTGERTMLQQTVDRVLPLVPVEHIYILTGPDHAPAIAEQLPDLPKENIFIEPSPRGTAPCLGLAAMRLRQSNPGHSVMLSLHADHAIAQEEAFMAAGALADQLEGFLVATLMSKSEVALDVDICRAGLVAGAAAVGVVVR